MSKTQRNKVKHNSKNTNIQYNANTGYDTKTFSLLVITVGATIIMIVILLVTVGVLMHNLNLPSVICMSSCLCISLLFNIILVIKFFLLNSIQVKNNEFHYMLLLYSSRVICYSLIVAFISVILSTKQIILPVTSLMVYILSPKGDNTTMLANNSILILISIATFVFTSITYVNKYVKSYNKSIQMILQLVSYILAVTAYFISYFTDIFGYTFKFYYIILSILYICLHFYSLRVSS